MMPVSIIRQWPQVAQPLLIAGCIFAAGARLSSAAPPPGELVTKLTAVVREHCPDAKFEPTDQAFTAKHGTMEFTVHRIASTGEVMPATDQQEGPNIKGFLLVVSIENGQYGGPLALPQVLNGPYYPTYVDRPPAGDHEHYYSINFSYGSAIAPQLKHAILAALPRSKPGGRKQDNGQEWWIQVTAAAKTYRVRPDGSGWTEVPHVAPRGILSPDRKRIVYADVPDDNKPRWNSEIFVADADGSNARRLTKGESQNNSPSWMPDGKRIIFASNRTGVWQVYAMDAEGANVEQLTKQAEGAEKPKLAPDGRLAYLVPHERQGKLRFQDLVIRDGADSKAIVQHAWLYSDYAWSPDATSIAYGKLGSLVFHDLATGKEREINFAKDIDAQMRSHAALNLAWRPDSQAIACSVIFLGGRAAGPSGITKMIGDEEIFIIPREGRPTWFKARLPTVDIGAPDQRPGNVPASRFAFPETPRSIAWVRQKAE